MKILITGGLGYIGSHLIVSLIESGYKAIILDNLSNSNKSVLSKIKEITNSDVTFIEGDIINTNLIVDVINNFNITAIIHMAGLKSISESISNPLHYYDNNVHGLISVLMAMNISGVKNLIFSSSATVYGVPEYLPVDEFHRLDATNPYGKTKLQSEQILKDLYSSDNSWRITVLRYFNPVGAHESGLIGESPSGTPNNLLPYISSVAMGRYSDLKIFGNDYDTKDGTGIRDYIHVMDLAEGHVAALKYLINYTGIEFINLGAGIGYSVLDILSAYEKVSLIKIPFSYTSRRPGDVPICFANANKALSLLGWSAHRTLEQICATQFKWEMTNHSVE